MEATIILFLLFFFSFPEVASEQPQLLSDSQSLTHLSGGVEEASGHQSAIHEKGCGKSVV